VRTGAAGESALLLLDVIDLLNAQARGVSYAVIGALAASVHGVVRASLDADVLLSAGIQEAANLERLFAAAFRTEMSRGDFEDPIAGLLKITDRYGNRVDLLMGLQGFDPEGFSRVIEIPFQGTPLKFVGREDFIAMKVFAGGPMDLVDAKRAISAAGATLDLDLLRRLAQRYGRSVAVSLEQLLAPPPAD
jgi:hypothetical protein